jgi:hypothetical protein
VGLPVSDATKVILVGVAVKVSVKPLDTVELVLGVAEAVLLQDATDAERVANTLAVEEGVGDLEAVRSCEPLGLNDGLQEAEPVALVEMTLLLETEGVGGEADQVLVDVRLWWSVGVTLGVNDKVGLWLNVGRFEALGVSEAVWDLLAGAVQDSVGEGVPGEGVTVWLGLMEVKVGVGVGEWVNWLGVAVGAVAVNETVEAVGDVVCLDTEREKEAQEGVVLGVQLEIVTVFDRLCND